MNVRKDTKCPFTVWQYIPYLYEMRGDHHNEDIAGFKHSDLKCLRIQLIIMKPRETYVKKINKQNTGVKVCTGLKIVRSLCRWRKPTV